MYSKVFFSVFPLFSFFLFFQFSKHEITFPHEFLFYIYPCFAPSAHYVKLVTTYSPTCQNLMNFLHKKWIWKIMNYVIKYMTKVTQPRSFSPFREEKTGWLRIRKVHSFLHQTFHLSLPLATAELETFPTLA